MDTMDIVMRWVFAVIIGALLLALAGALIACLAIKIARARRASEPEAEVEPPKPKPKPAAPVIPVRLRQDVISCLKDYTVVDIETTGLDPVCDAITEVGALRVRGGEVVATYQSLVNPGRKIPSNVSKLTGIYGDMLVGQPKIADVLPLLDGFIGEDVVVGHNITFDLKFLAAAHEKCGMAAVEHKWLDTCEPARILYPDAKKYSLGALAHHLELKHKPQHRVYDDVIATNDLYMHEMETVQKLNGVWPNLKDMYRPATSVWARPAEGSDLLAKSIDIDNSTQRYHYNDVTAYRDEACKNEHMDKQVLAGRYSDVRRRAEFYAGDDFDTPLCYLPAGRLNDMVYDYMYKDGGFVAALCDTAGDSGPVKLLELAFYLPSDEASDDDDDDDDFLED